MTQNLDQLATWCEIHSQPAIWREWGAYLDFAGLRAWIAAQSFDEVWFCGAGTRAYIGDIIAAAVKCTRSVPTTDFMTSASYFLSGAKPLVVNFGRSGNSAESVGTLDALDALAPHTPRINITCNKDGALAKRTSGAPTQVILLPNATHDAGFAMTSSWSIMLLKALALFDAPCDSPSRMTIIANQLDDLLPKFAAGPRSDRVVYVSAGPLAFAAREAALKVMELSAGQIPALWHSTLGFRHGPKIFVADGTEIKVFTSPDTPMSRYDTDLAAELRTQFPDASLETIGAGGDIDIAMPFGAIWAAPLCVASAQVRGVVWFHNLGLNVDDPFSGQSTLSRVVSGVKLYPVVS